MSRANTLRFLALAATAWALLAGAAKAHVRLLDPNGGQTLMAGSVYTIRWTVLIGHNTRNWDLYYSTTGPTGPWLTIALDLPPGNIAAGSVHTFDWTVPATPSNRVRVRIVQDNSGTSYNDHSDSDLAIVTAAAAYAPFGSGCAGSAGIPMLGAAPGSRPILGRVFSAALQYSAPSAAGAFVITSLAQTSPVDLTSLGLTGCSRYIGSGGSVFVPLAGGTGAWTFPISNSSVLIGLEFFQQALVLDSAAGNPAGAVVSNPAQGLLSDH